MGLVRTCSDLRQPTAQETSRFIESMDSSVNELWFCGWCNFGRNKWLLIQMLYDPENEFMVTPCCHTEAKEALVGYDTDNYDQDKEDQIEIDSLRNQ
jgi:hypothetical protein